MQCFWLCLEMYHIKTLWEWKNKYGTCHKNLISRFSLTYLHWCSFTPILGQIFSSDYLDDICHHTVLCILRRLRTVRWQIVENAWAARFDTCHNIYSTKRMILIPNEIKVLPFQITLTVIFQDPDNTGNRSIGRKKKVSDYQFLSY